MFIDKIELESPQDAAYRLLLENLKKEQAASN
jgi:hypothetical protein